MTYDKYSPLIDCKKNDKVYVYTKSVLKNDGEINKSNVGIVESIEQSINEDWMGVEYLEYTVVIKMKDGKIITIEDDIRKPFFRKYEFITLRDLEKMYAVKI